MTHIVMVLCGFSFWVLLKNNLLVFFLHQIGKKVALAVTERFGKSSKYITSGSNKISILYISLTIN